jgi:hypothetical protein
MVAHRSIRKATLRLSGILLMEGALVAGVAGARTLDLARPEDVIAAEVRLGCAPDPARPRISSMTGQLYSVRAGEPSRHLFDVQAVNTHACKTVQDPQRGPGYRSVGREIMVYLDPASGRILETWPNPWTGETVDVVPMLNDPVNMRAPKYALDAKGQPAAVWEGTIINGQASSRRINPFFRDSPLGGPYQDYVGGKYAVMEMSVTTVTAAPWLDTTAPTPVPVTSVWTRISPWLPWMKMGGREGSTVLQAVWTGGTFEDVPEPLRSFIRSKHPDFATAPPLDDARENVSSWDGIRQAIDEKRAPKDPQR